MISTFASVLYPIFTQSNKLTPTRVPKTISTQKILFKIKNLLSNVNPLNQRKTITNKKSNHHLHNQLFKQKAVYENNNSKKNSLCG